MEEKKDSKETKQKKKFMTPQKYTIITIVFIHYNKKNQICIIEQNITVLII